MSVTAQITITVSDTGALQVSGSIDNTLLAFGMLEAAKEAIVEHHKQMERKVRPAGIDDVAQFAKPDVH